MTQKTHSTKIHLEHFKIFYIGRKKVKKLVPMDSAATKILWIAVKTDLQIWLQSDLD